MQGPLSILGGATVLGQLEMGIWHGMLPQPCQQSLETAHPYPTQMELWVMLPLFYMKGSPGDLLDTLTPFRLRIQ